MHHIRPLWAGGEDDKGYNLLPLENSVHKSVHDWWREQIQSKSPSINQQMEICAKINGKSKGNIKERQIGVGNKYPQ